MRIACDVDNVLNNLTESVLQIYNADHNDTLTVNDIVNYGIEEFVKPELQKDFHKIFVDKRVWKGIQIIKGSVDVIQKYHNQGHTIYIVTATEPANMTKKARWLQRTLPFLNIRKRLICLQEKQMLNGSIDVLIDDCLNNLIGGTYKKIVLDYPWNRNTDDEQNELIRCKDWNDIDHALENLVRNL